MANIYEAKKDLIELRAEGPVSMYKFFDESAKSACDEIYCSLKGLDILSSAEMSLYFHALYERFKKKSEELKKEDPEGATKMAWDILSGMIDDLEEEKRDE